MKKTYWNNEKKVSSKIEGATVSWGYTENPAVNASIAMNKIYYDMYNNGGCNLFDGWNEPHEYLEELINKILLADIGTVFGKINLTVDCNTIQAYLEETDEDGDYIHLEVLADEVFKALESKYLTFPVYTTHFDWDNERLSREPFEGATNTVTFGLKREQEKWEQAKMNSGYKLAEGSK